MSVGRQWPFLPAFFVSFSDAFLFIRSCSPQSSSSWAGEERKEEKLPNFAFGGGRRIRGKWRVAESRKGLVAGRAIFAEMGGKGGGRRKDGCCGGGKRKELEGKGKAAVMTWQVYGFCWAGGGSNNTQLLLAQKSSFKKLRKEGKNSIG